MNRASYYLMRELRAVEKRRSRLSKRSLAGPEPEPNTTNTMAPASKRTPASESGSGSESESEDDSASENGQDVQIVDDEEQIPEVKLDVSKLNPLSPEVIEKQATINIGQSSLCAR